MGLFSRHKHLVPWEPHSPLGVAPPLWHWHAAPRAASCVLTGVQTNPQERLKRILWHITTTRYTPKLNALVRVGLNGALFPSRTPLPPGTRGDAAGGGPAPVNQRHFKQAPWWELRPRRPAACARHLYARQTLIHAAYMHGSMATRLLVIY